MRARFLQRMIVSIATVVGVCGGVIAADMPTKAPIAPAPTNPAWKGRHEAWTTHRTKPE